MGQEGRRRPAAKVVALVDVGAPVGVDPHGDEARETSEATSGSAYVVRSISWHASHHAAVIESSTGLPSVAARANASALHGSHWIMRAIIAAL